MILVFIAQQCVLDRNFPVDSQRGIKDRDTAICLGCIEIVAFVLEKGRLAENGETMGESTRNKKLAMIVRSQLDSDVLPVSGTPLPYIDGNVKDLAFYATYEFRLSERRALEMETAHDSV